MEAVNSSSKFHKLGNKVYYTVPYNENEYNLALSLYSINEPGFNKPLLVQNEMIVYDKIEGLASAFNIKSNNYHKLIPSFVIQIVGILDAINSIGYSITKLNNKDIGIQYTNIKSIQILGYEIPTYGILYKLINYDILKSTKVGDFCVRLFDIFGGNTAKVPPNYNDILDSIEQKKYGIEFDGISGEALYWMYMIFNPRIVTLETGTKVKITKYLDDNDYMTIANNTSKPKKIIQYFIKKIPT